MSGPRQALQARRVTSAPTRFAGGTNTLKLRLMGRRKVRFDPHLAPEAITIAVEQSKPDRSSKRSARFRDRFFRGQSQCGASAGTKSH